MNKGRYYNLRNQYDLLLLNRYKGEPSFLTKDDLNVIVENISRAKYGEYKLNELRNILNIWYNGLSDEEKLKLELGDDNE